MAIWKGSHDPTWERKTNRGTIKHLQLTSHGIILQVFHAKNQVGEMLFRSVMGSPIICIFFFPRIPTRFADVFLQN